MKGGIEEEERRGRYVERRVKWNEMRKGKG